MHVIFIFVTTGVEVQDLTDSPLVQRKRTIRNPYLKKYKRTPWSANITQDSLFFSSQGSKTCSEGTSVIDLDGGTQVSVITSPEVRKAGQAPQFRLGSWKESSSSSSDEYSTNYGFFKWKVLDIKLPHPMLKEAIKPNNFTKMTAPHSSTILCFERSDPEDRHVPISNKTGMLSQQINHCDILVRGTNGWYYFNKAHKRPHYEVEQSEMDNFLSKVKEAGKTYTVYGLDQGVHSYHVGGYFFVASNSDKNLQVLLDLGIDIFIKELLLVEGNEVIGIDGNRGNRGYSFGYTGSLCVERLEGDNAASPVLVAGTRRFAEFFLQFSMFLKDIAKKHNLPRPFEGGDDVFLNRQEKFSEAIIEDNILESVSIRFLIHGPVGGSSTGDLLKFHVDGENCTQRRWDGCCVLYKDFWVENIKRWVTMSIIGTSRKSIGDSMIRSHKMGLAVHRMLDYVKSMPTELVHITPATFECPKDSGIDWFIKPIHCQTTVHLSICVNGILAVDCALHSLKEGQKLSRYLVLEMIYAFTRTNNAYRYHKFIRSFIREGWENREHDYWELPIGKNETFVGKFLNWLVTDYGGFNGCSGPKLAREDLPNLIRDYPVDTTNVAYQSPEDQGKKRGKEGVVRYQSSSNRPQTDFSIYQTLFHLNELVDVINNTIPSKAKYRMLKENIEKKTEGVADLLSQKIFILMVMTGLVTNKEWIDFTTPGSERHWDNLTREPWNLNKGQEARLVERISEELSVPQATAEEIGCKRLKSKESYEVRIRESSLFGVRYQRIGDDKKVEVFHAYLDDKESDYSTFHGFPMEESSNWEKNHYVSAWKQSGGIFTNTEGRVFLATDVEGTHILKAGKNTLQKDLMNKYSKDTRKTHSQARDFSLGKCQLLLNSGSYFWIHDCMTFLESHMGLRSGVLQDKKNGVIIQGKPGEGYTAEDGVAITEYCRKHRQELYSNSPGHNNSKVEWLKEAYSPWVYKTKQPVSTPFVGIIC